MTDQVLTERTRAEFPMLAGDVIRAGMKGGDVFFPFRSWAAAQRFAYPADAENFLAECQSAAEAYFARPFVLRAGVEYPEPRVARAGELELRLQVNVANYRVDFVLECRVARLAIEIDGMAFHHRFREQIAQDYLRQRRIVLRGYPVIRFTAQEVFSDPNECWRQIDSIMASWIGGGAAR